MSTFQKNYPNNADPSNIHNNNKVEENVETLEDSKIFAAVAVLAYSVPDPLDQRVNAALVVEENKSRQPGWERFRLPRLSLSAYATAILVLVTLLVFSPFNKTSNQVNTSKIIPMPLPMQPIHSSPPNNTLTQRQPMNPNHDVIQPRTISPPNEMDQGKEINPNNEVDQSNQGNQSSEVNEIKTELVLSDANIKIIWVQKKDFKINQ